MERKTSRILFFFLPLLFFCFHGENDAKSFKGDTYGIFFSKIVFIEDLSIKREDWNPSGLAVSEDGVIYVTDQLNLIIYVFDKNGNEIDKASFKKGQGPGDFKFMDIAVSSKHELYVFDKNLQRLTILDRKWKVLDTVLLRDQRLFFCLNSQDDLIYWKNESAISHDRLENKKSSLTKYSLKSGKTNTYCEYLTPQTLIINPPLCSFPLFTVYGIFKINKKDNLYYALSNKYRINVISPQGRFIRSIEKESKPRKITDNDLNKEYLSACKKVAEQSGNKPKFIIPESMPDLADMFILDNDHLLTITYEKPSDSPTLKGDLFDSDGKFIESVDVPKYYLWDKWMNLSKKCAVMKNGYFYVITETEDDTFALKRYRINLQ